jgi:hypothetical protein
MTGVSIVPTSSVRPSLAPHEVHVWWLAPESLAYPWDPDTRREILDPADMDAVRRLRAARVREQADLPLLVHVERG